MSRNNLYNLDDEEEVELTHGGRSLSSLSYFEESSDSDERDHLEDEEDGDDFGGLTKVDTPEDYDPESKYKTKGDIMKEVISKSKFYKYMNQKEQEERMALVKQLDDEFDEIKDLLDYQPKKEDGESGTTEEPQEETDYDRLVKLLSRPGVKKGIALDPLKDEEEKQRVEAERKQQLEIERLARMDGEVPKQPVVQFSADDLDDYSTRKYLGDDFADKPETNKRRKTEETTDRPLKESKKISLKERYNELIEEIISKTDEIYVAVSNEEIKKIVSDCHTLGLEIYDICSQITEEIAVASRDFVKVLHKSFIQNLENGTSGVPTLEGIFLSRLMGHMWSITDRRHHVLTPLVISLGSMLAISKVESKKDMVLYLLHINLFYSFVEGAKRFSTEPINALLTILDLFVEVNSKKQDEEDKIKLTPLLSLKPTLLKIDKIKSFTKKTEISDPISLLHLNNDDAPSDLLKLQFVYSALNMLQQYMDLYKNEIGCIPLFEMTQEAVERLQKVTNIPKVIKEKCVSYIKYAQSIVSQLKSHRYPLQQFTKKPESISQLTPDFQERYFGTKVTENKAKRDAKKLVKKFKSEQRGAEKELRKDSQFIANLKLQKQLKADKERNLKTKDAFKFFENQQREANELKRSKKRKSVSGL